MLKPTNSAAEQIVSMRSINSDIDIQIESLRATQQRNLDTIKAFEEIATWEEVDDEIETVEEEVIEEVIEEVAPVEEAAPVVEEPEVAPEEVPE